MSISGLIVVKKDSIILTDDFYVYVYCADKVEVRFLKQKLKNLGQDLYKIAPNSNSYAVGSKKGSCKIQGEEQLLGNHQGANKLDDLRDCNQGNYNEMRATYTVFEYPQPINPRGNHQGTAKVQ